MDRSEKLLTKLSGFLISCAMPAVSWPSEAIFRTAPAGPAAAKVRQRRLGGSTRAARARSWNSRAFSMASTDCPAKVCNRVGMVGAKPPAVRRRITSPPTTLSCRSSGTASTAWMPAATRRRQRASGPVARRPHVPARASAAALAEMGFTQAGASGRAAPPHVPSSCRRRPWARRPPRASSNS